MAEAQSSSALAAVSFEGSDLASLLQKEFKPKSEEAKSAVELAVQTLAQQALAAMIEATPWAAARIPVYSNTTARLLGSPQDPAFCIRSIECLPRRILRHILHANVAAWIVGLLFRAAGGLIVVCYLAFTAATVLRPVRVLAGPLVL